MVCKLSTSLVCVISLTFTQALSAQVSESLKACTEIYKNSTHNYTDSQQQNVELSRSFSSFCKKDGSVSTSATGVGLSAIVYSIPFKFSVDHNTDEQKMEEFCKVGPSQYDSWSSGSQNDSVVVTEALSNFNACIALANSGLQFETSINQPATLSVSGSATAAFDGLLTSITYDPNTMTCSSADFDNRHRPTVYQGPVHLSTKQPFAFSCIKKKQTSADGKSSFYPRTTLTITAGGVSPLSIAFPSDTVNGYELASQAKIAVDTAVEQLASANAGLATQQQRADSLQNRLTGVTVSLHARAYGEKTGWGCGVDFDNRLKVDEATNCTGGAKVMTANDGRMWAGEKCGYHAIAYACVTIPQ
jgi:hypothetical protein